MIFNRTVHRVASLPSKTPCWSGPRWYNASMMRWATPLSTTRLSRVNPAIPHITTNTPFPAETVLRSILRWICVEYSTRRGGRLVVFGCLRIDYGNHCAWTVGGRGSDGGQKIGRCPNPGGMDSLVGHVSGFARIRTTRCHWLMAASGGGRECPLHARRAFAARGFRRAALSRGSQFDRVSFGLRSGERPGAPCRARVVGVAVPHPCRYSGVQLPILRHPVSLAGLGLPVQRDRLVDAMVLVLHLRGPRHCVLPAVEEGMADPRRASSPTGRRN